MTPEEQRIYTECTGRKIPPTKKAREAWIIAGRRARKALAIDTPIPTPTGWTAMGDLQVGDMVFDETGQPTRVVAATNVMHDRPCYELTFSDGEKITADAGHLWRIFGRAGR
jgi:replicative DNA helicase